MIDERFIVNLQGRAYPTWPGILDLATKSGLLSLTTKLLQIPSDTNGHTAIVQATATFSDNRTFSDVGDANTRNVGKHLIEAIIRMASTRAKGRVLRDACNVGDALLEEIGEEPASAPAARESQMNRGGNGARAAAESAVHPRAAPQDGQICSVCQVPLTLGQHDVSLRVYGYPLCPNHQREENAARAIPSDPRAKLKDHWANLQHDADACEIDVRNFPDEMTDEQIIAEGKAIRKLMQDWKKNKELEDAPAL